MAINQLFIILFCLNLSFSYYSNYFRRCQLSTLSKNHNYIHLGEAPTERVARYDKEYAIEPAPITKVPLAYKAVPFYYREFIAAGGSGEVYLV